MGMTRRLKARLQQAWDDAKALDWHVVFMLGPRHKFSEAQWALLDQRSAITASVKLCAWLNALLLGVLAAWQMPPPLQLGGFVVGFLMALALLWQAARLWRRPTMRTLYLGYVWVCVMAFVSTFLMGMFSGALRLEESIGKEEAGQLALDLVLLGVVGIWVLAMARNEMLAGWLREHEQQQQALALAQQLSSAQIQPHFLFNSLASLQHWVRSRDERAAILLDALTAYLRATLPLFNRQLLSLGEELEAVRQYLAVMQVRLGQRLQVQIEVPEAVASVQLPPALMLTLVENAIEHGVVPKLGSALLRIETEQQDQSLLVRVIDDGPGLPEAPAQPVRAGRGVGLSNSRLRLAQTYGEAARLSLRNAELGGCIAELQLPWSPDTRAAS
ncbi:sensor histidine kinase [Kinneretia aquatilis]|uniref:sensor histidine kinase n=1 Tax=Kinneretia aquatilis TaxID=2070761 RepID=UPI001056E3EA|nr:histidine kinase [Paucibacter aquatile]